MFDNIVTVKIETYGTRLITIVKAHGVREEALDEDNPAPFKIERPQQGYTLTAASYAGVPSDILDWMDDNGQSWTIQTPNAR